MIKEKKSITKRESWASESVNILFILLMALFLTISFFAVMSCNADDAGTYMWLYWVYEIGSYDYSIRELLEPWNLTCILLYILGIGKSGTETVIYCFAVWYFICIFLTLSLAMKGQKKNRWLLLLATFIFIPYSQTNKNHLIPVAITLLNFYAIYTYVNTKKRILLIGTILLAVYSVVVINERVILLLFLGATLVIYGFVWCLQNIARQKILYFGALVITVLVGIIKLIDKVCMLCSGNGISFLEAWGGYGGEAYLTWIDIYDLFDKGIPSLFSSLMIQYNIPVEGGLIQVNSFFWIIRIFIVVLALIALICRWRDIVKRGIANMNIIDALSTISFSIVIFVNIINGMIEYYEIEGAPINRYASLAWFMLIIILVRWINEKYNPIIMGFVLGKKITSGTVLGMIFMLLIVSYSKPIYFGRDNNALELCQGEIEFLKSKEEEYKYGISSYWKSNPITAMTNGEYVSCPGWIIQDELDSDRLYLEPKYDGIYDDGSNYFNYIISHHNNTMTINKENIELIRGDYIEKKEICNGDDASVIYLYDYDVRWDPRLVMEAVGTDYELVNPIEYHFDFPVGTNRIDMTVTNSENFDFEVIDNSDIQNVEVQKIDDNKIYIDVVCLQNTNVSVKVSRKEEEITTIHKIVLKRVEGAVTVSTDEAKEQSKILLNSGDYIFTFEGKNLDKLDISWKGNDIGVVQLTDGRRRKRYHIHIESKQSIQYEVIGNNCKVEKISYENAVLFKNGQTNTW